MMKPSDAPSDPPSPHPGSGSGSGSGPASGSSRYGVAFVVFLAATLVRFLLDPLLGDSVPYITYFLAIVVAAWLGGFGPGLMVTLLGAGFAVVLFMLPPHTEVTSSTVHVIGLAVYLAVGVATALVGGGMRLARRRVDEYARRLEQEIAERKRSEAAVAEQRERLFVTLSSIGDAVIVTDAAGRVTLMNPTAAELTGWPAADAEHKPLDEVFRIVNEETRLPVDNPVHKVLEKGGVVGLANHTILIARNGSERPIDDSAAPIRGPDGRIIGVVLVFRDVGERKQAEAERDRMLTAEREARSAAEAANRLKDEFLATLSHELRTPLNAIVGWVHMLRTGTLSADESRDALEVIERNSKAQTTLIGDLLDVSRIISGKMVLESRKVDLTAAAAAALDTVRVAADAKGVRLESDFGSGVPPVSGDASRLQQVFWNLLSNAVKFTPAGGTVRVCVRRDGSRAQVIVADDGQGIPAEFLPHVFDRFRQADSATTRAHGGLGLGLAIVRHLVEMHGGTVRAESAGRGRGATFTVSLPIRAVVPEPAAAPAVASAPPGSLFATSPDGGLSGKRVLVVDDEADARHLLATLLRKVGAQVFEASSSSDALEAVPRVRPDVLVSDIGMPDEDGFALIHKVRMMASDRGGGTPAVALTAFARAEDRDRALRAGFQLHLAKPVESSALIGAVAKLAGRNT